MKNIILQGVVVIVFALGIFSSVTLVSISESVIKKEAAINRDTSTQVTGRTEFMPDVILMKQFLKGAEEIYRVYVKL